MMRLLSRATGMLLVALLLAGIPAQAQTPAAAVTGALGGADVSLQNAIDRSPSAILQISGTWTGTITFEGSADGTAWTTVAVVKQSTAAVATTTTANDTFLLSNPGYGYVRARMSAYTSGTAIVSIRGGYGATSAQAAGLWTGQATTLQAGASGTAGNIKLFPATASKGYVNFTVSNQTTDTAITTNFAAMGQATTLTVPDPGGATASFVLTAGAQTLGGVKTFSAIPIFPTTGITLNATTISEAEIGVLDSVTPGTAAASKAVVLDASSQIDALDIKTTFKKGGVDVTGTAAELNVLTGLFSASSTLVLGAGGSPTQTVTITLKDANAAQVKSVQRVEVYFCTDTVGAAPSAAGANTSVTATTGAIVTAHTAKLHLTAVTDANGILVLVVNNTGGGGAYTDRAVLVLPTGKVVVSAALNVATSEPHHN